MKPDLEISGIEINGQNDNHTGLVVLSILLHATKVIVKLGQLVAISILSGQNSANVLNQYY